MANNIFPRVVSILQHAGYRLYQRPGELNIVGIRSKSAVPDQFDDELHVFFRDDTGQRWKYFVYQVTTDPGTFFLGSSLGNELGTAILREGQYVDCYALGLHKGQYEALVNVKPVAVIRDYDRDSMLDFHNGTSYQTTGINIHRASSAGVSKTVDNWSAGCTVFADAAKFSEFISLCEKHRSRWGNKFTYTLIDFRMQRKETFQRIGLIGGLVLLAVATVAVLTDTELEDVKEWLKKHAPAG